MCNMRCIISHWLAVTSLTYLASPPCKSVRVEYHPQSSTFFLIIILQSLTWWLVNSLSCNNLTNVRVELTIDFLISHSPTCSSENVVKFDALWVQSYAIKANLFRGKCNKHYVKRKYANFICNIQFYIL